MIKNFDSEEITLNYKGPVNPNDVYSVLSKYHGALFLSDCENLPITHLEKLAIGLPVIFFDLPPMNENKVDINLSVKHKSKRGLKLAIQYLLNTSFENLINISKKHKEISLKYSWKKCQIDTQNLLIRDD